MASAFSFFAVLLCLCGCFRGYRKSQARAAAVAAAERNGELQLHATGGAATNTAARLPAFKYIPSVKHNVKGRGEEAATCSVCLGAFQLGEKVRLLPACLHLYHAECIDLWLDAHSTCPICRSDTDPAASVGRVPPV
jgi:E3 ubiquitin-protein ligase RNF38/44